jgi:hypothetical protein
MRRNRYRLNKEGEGDAVSARHLSELRFARLRNARETHME